MGKAIAIAIVTGVVGILMALIGKHVFGVSSPWLSLNPTINVGIPTPDPAQASARRAADDRRQHDDRLAAIRREQELARAQAEAVRAAEEADSARRRMRQADESERLQRAERVQAWRRANGGCDPPLRRQCMFANGQQMGCICTR